MRGQGPHTARMGLEGVSGAGRPRPRAQGRRQPAGAGTRRWAPKGLCLVAAPTQLDFSLLLLSRLV